MRTLRNRVISAWSPGDKPAPLAAGPGAVLAQTAAVALARTAAVTLELARGASESLPLARLARDAAGSLLLARVAADGTILESLPLARVAADGTILARRVAGAMLFIIAGRKFLERLLMGCSFGDGRLATEYDDLL